MKKLVSIILICVAIASCTNDKIQISELQKAKTFFEDNATALSFHLCGLWKQGCADENCGCGCQDH